MGVMINRNAALNLWRVVTLESVRGSGPDLTARQLAVLMTVYLTDAPHTVRDLARKLATPKPAITRAVDALSDMGFVRRVRDPEDRRNVLVERTTRGGNHLAQFADRITRAARKLS